ncbi:oxysterol-binding protein-related protein 11-like isoform X1 [Pecten maximus]|uniref:oxysterol-binding protein-related protein 11-like isoform X1 n=2 Tax=Pecten maximus TaxID=6579 RepID=UPI001458518E|nr:oxysterol-binding protein-related protein 11-like isoform X1 [Pecten maximus]
MAATEKVNLGLPDLSGLSEAEALQVMAVMQRAKDFEEVEGAKHMRQPMEGQLHKYTNAFKGWQFRWFVLDPDSGMLEYFEKEEQKKQRPRGYVQLAASVISPSDEDSQTFTVNAANGELYRLRASDAKERQHWVDKLRSTAEYHTANMVNSSPPQKPDVRSLSMNLSPNETAHVPVRLRKSPSVRGDQDVAVPTKSVAAKSHGKAPAAHPHTLDPFREVKEYIIEAEDYSETLNEKINHLPSAGETISGLDPDILLIKATSNATLTCLSQCLKMLQQRQGASVKPVPNTTAINWGDPNTQPVNTHVAVPKATSSGGVPSPTGSFSSATSLPFTLPDQVQDGPINHDEEVEDSASYRDTDLGNEVEEHKSVILHLLSQLKLGMDLTKVVLPTFILERRSLLEMFADCMAHPDFFLKIADLPDPESRMLAVLEWYLTSFHAARQGSVAKKPYNPIIGETFHCSWRLQENNNKSSQSKNTSGSPDQENQTIEKEGETCNKPVQLTFCAEQVSHHPPVSAFYFECPEKQMCMNASIYTKSRFMGMSVGVQMVGKICLKLLQHDEEYVFMMPSAYARSILTVPWAEMGDKITINCQKTNFVSNVTFHTKPFYGGKLHRVSAEVKNTSLGTVPCKVQGEWNNILEFSYANGETKIIDVNNLNILRKRVRPLGKQGDYESRKLWEHVTNALKIGDVNTATEHKHFLEERQREGERHRKETSTDFPTKYFHKVDDVWTYNTMLEEGNMNGSA